jgi:hypothetical protein
VLLWSKEQNDPLKLVFTYLSLATSISLLCQKVKLLFARLFDTGVKMFLKTMFRLGETLPDCWFSDLGFKFWPDFDLRLGAARLDHISRKMCRNSRYIEVNLIWSTPSAANRRRNRKQNRIRPSYVFLKKNCISIANRTWNRVQNGARVDGSPLRGVYMCPILCSNHRSILCTICTHRLLGFDYPLETH